jgi:hypothetical protein
MNMGLAVSNHFCGGELASSSISFGEGDIGCGMEESMSSCEMLDHSNTIKKESCCANTYLQLKLDDEFNTSITIESDLDVDFLSAFVFIYINSNSFNTTKKTEFHSYSPPLLFRDIQIMNQTFLI